MDALIMTRAWSKQQRARIVELEVALAQMVHVGLAAFQYAVKHADGENDDLVDLANNTHHALVVYALPELGKSNAAEFGADAMPSTTEQEIYDALGMGESENA